MQDSTDTAEISRGTQQRSDSTAARAARVHKAVVAAEASWRARWPVLAHQDGLGLVLWILSLATFAATVVLVATGKVSPWLTVPLAALPLSILHELEHDLIHDLYFKSAPRVQNLLFAGIWLAKASLNPWARKDIHLRHHRLSGQPGDVEERLIGLGVQSLPLRLLLAVLPASAVVLIPRIRRDAPDWQVIRGGMWSLSRQIQRVDLLFFGLPLILPSLWALGWMPARLLFLAWIAPNMLRHTSIALLSSYSHYYDIARNDVTVQNQILRHPLLLPLQVFAFDFGATHVIHHYVVNQPFYVRHLVRRVGWAALEAEGTPVNDTRVIRAQLALARSWLTGQ